MWFSDIDEHTYRIAAVFSHSSRAEDHDIRMVDELQSALQAACPSSRSNVSSLMNIVQEIASDLENEAEHLFHLECAADSLKLQPDYAVNIKRCLSGYFQNFVDYLMVSYRQRLLEQIG